MCCLIYMCNLKRYGYTQLRANSGAITWANATLLVIGLLGGPVDLTSVRQFWGGLAIYGG